MKLMGSDPKVKHEGPAAQTPLCAAEIFQKLFLFDDEQKHFSCSAVSPTLKLNVSVTLRMKEKLRLQPTS